jgi:DNA-binding beta-propeller fold protein YncE
VTRREFLAITGSLAIAGCGAGAGRRIHAQAWGSQGTRDGSFIQPRAMGFDGGELYVIDTTGRVQVFSPTGDFIRSWRTPDDKNGTPTAIHFTPDRVIIPDTHYSKILEYTRQGELLDQWGSYGTGPDQFIYPTGLVRDSAGTFYISEYGIDAERVHVFDKNHQFLRQWGSHGEAPGQFNRAMALLLAKDEVLVVADTANHRLQCFSKDGELLRVIGSAGTEPGQLKFPHDLSLGPDNTVYVAEYGANRISRWSLDGDFIAVYGGPGRALGSFNAPRGVTVSPDNMVYVADTDNHRIQYFPVEAWP